MMVSSLSYVLGLLVGSTAESVQEIYEYLDFFQYSKPSYYAINSFREIIA